MTGKLEKELIKATKFQPPKGGYKDRQDELAALARLGSKLPDDDFDDLSDEAGNWVNAAVKAIMAKGTIKDFIDDTRKASKDDAEEAPDAEADEDAEEQEPDNSDSSGEDDTEADAQAEADAESGNEAEEAREAALPVRGKAVKFNKGGNPSKGGRPKADPEKVKKSIEKLASAKELEGVKTRYDDMTGEMDRYGVLLSTKTHDAVLMYEKGTTSKGLTDKLGGRFYNILRKLSEQGHLVERSPEGIFTLTHRDDILQKQAAKKATATEKKGKKKVSQTPKEKADAIMEIPATYCNSVEWTFTNLGVRLTYGELSILDGEPPTHRVAVFLPWAICDIALPGLANTAQEVKARMQEAQQQATQAKPN